MTKPRRFSRRRKVLDRYQCSTATLYRWMEQGLFPRPIPIGPNMVAWLDDELDAHDAALIAKRDAGADPQAA